MITRGKVNFHNRFDIEVRDFKTNELKKSGFAENIILNQMYDRLCNFSAYFVNIHFGTGTGTLSPSRTTLFTHLGTKSALSEEIIKAFPTSKWTRKITLNPEEFIGSTITEVGIAFGSTNTNLLTHAMIKDAEGNPLTITKESTDVIIIYATVFITLMNSSDVFFSKATYSPSGYSDGSVPMKFNNLIEQLTGSTPGTIGIVADASDHDGVSLSHYCKIFEIAPSVTADVPNKKRIYSCRIPITDANTLKKITSFGLTGILRHKKVVSETVTNLVIGVGDGIKTNFDMPISGIQNPVIKINGVETTDFTINDGKNVIDELPLTEFIDDAWLNTTIRELLSSLRLNYSVSNQTDGLLYGILKLKESLNGKTLNLKMRGSNGLSSSNLIIESSENGSDWTTRLSVSGKSADGIKMASTVITWDDLYYRIKSTTTYGQSDTGVWISGFSIPQIAFNSAPENNLAITLSGLAPYYPKSKDYITDVTFELIFGEEV